MFKLKFVHVSRDFKDEAKNALIPIALKTSTGMAFNANAKVDILNLWAQIAVQKLIFRFQHALYIVALMAKSVFVMKDILNILQEYVQHVLGIWPGMETSVHTTNLVGRASYGRKIYNFVSQFNKNVEIIKYGMVYLVSVKRTILI